jgi:WD40 repeat protein
MAGKMRRSLLLLITPLLVACGIRFPSTVSPRPTPLLTPARPAAPLTAGNVSEMTELAKFEVDGAGPVAALTFTSDGQHLLAVYGKEGMLRRWRVAGGVLLATLDVGPVGVTAATFDAEGRLLATGAGQTSLAVKAGYNVDLRGARLWDTQSGQLLFEFDALDIGPLLADVALSPDGHWFVGTERGGLTVWDATSGHGVLGGAEATELADGRRVPAMPGVVIFDPAGQWVVVAYEDGDIWGRIWDGKLLDGAFHWRYGPRGEISPAIPLALAFDPSRRWLAAVIGDELRVWDTPGLVSRECPPVKVGEGPAAALAFSPDGRLLAVGTGGGWQVWSVPGFELLASGTDQAVFAVAFNPDGRLLAWGDAEGVVHLWGKAMD